MEKRGSPFVTVDFVCDKRGAGGGKFPVGFFFFLRNDIGFHVILSA